jgi:UDP-N-acetylmuramate dehydrogenase
MSTRTSFEIRQGGGSATGPARAAFAAHFGDFVRFDAPLSPYVAYGIGGPADILVFPRCASDLEHLALLCQRFDLPATIIGSGTNLLVVDEGIRGVVISLLSAFQQTEIVSESPETVRIRTGGGVAKPALLDWAVERGFAGLEFSAGVPGTLGGGIFMNAGTKYGCYADVLVNVDLFDFEAGLRTVQRQDLYFGYRETAVGNTLVVSMEFLLKKGDSAALRHEVDRIIQERAEKQPLDYPSCGSTFRNPPEGLSAGRLIERSGLKGLRVGGAEISLKHANFILNKGGAKARDILALIDIIKKTVFEKFQVRLECEVIVLGATVELPQPFQDPNRVP